MIDSSHDVNDDDVVYGMCCSSLHVSVCGVCELYVHASICFFLEGLKRGHSYLECSESKPLQQDYTGRREYRGSRAYAITIQF